VIAPIIKTNQAYYLVDVEVRAGNAKHLVEAYCLAPSKRFRCLNVRRIAWTSHEAASAIFSGRQLSFKEELLLLNQAERCYELSNQPDDMLLHLAFTEAYGDDAAVNITPLAV
jgi:hypothetical protein